MAQVLVADDDPDILYLLEINLTRAGHEVVAVGDGAAALAAFAERDIDLAVLDVSMPHQTGIDVVRGIRGGDRRSDIPIILVTALAHPDHRTRGLAAGADDYVTKPFSIRTLCGRVDTLLAERQG